MEGEGKSLRVLGFNQNQRAAFVQHLMRFGIGDLDWKKFASRMKQKTYEEIHEYGFRFLSHIAEDITDSSTFTDGVPKEGLRIKDLLVRIAVLLLIRNKVKFAAENPGSPLFSDDILSHYAGLKGVKIWKEGHDLLLLQAVLKHGYGRWQAIIDDKDLKIQEVICLELNIPFINLPVPGQVSSHVQNNANMIKAESTCNQSRENGGSEIAADGINVTNAESTCNQSRGNGDTAIAVDGAQGSSDSRNQAQLLQESSILYHFRDMQRRLIDFVKKRFLLLEKALNTEECIAQLDEKLNSEPNTINAPSYISGEADTIKIDQLPQVEAIASEEFSIAACDDDPNRISSSLQ